MKRATVKYKETCAGVLSETDEGYEFKYLEEYIAKEGARAISLTMPIVEKAYKSKVLFPFFDGLIPEGWLLDVALRNTDISELDRFYSQPS